MWTFQGRRQLVGAARQERALRELNETAAIHTDLCALQAALASRFRDMADCQSMVFLEYAADQDVYNAVAWSGSTTRGRELHFRAQGNLVQWLEANEDGLPIPDDFGVFEYLDEEEQQALSLGHVRFCLPMMGTEALAGILLFIDERTGWRVRSSDRSFLLTCAEHAALACEAADQHRAAHAHLRSLHRADQLIVAGQMAAAVAHEVRNPLATIRSTIQYVMTSPSEWARKLDLLEETLQEVDRVDHTVSGMLSLSRPSILEMIDTDMIGVVRDALRLIRPYVEAQQVEVQVDLGQPLMVVGDVRELRQVFVNLLLNACQAMAPHGRIVVTADIVREDRHVPSSRYGAVRIADTGPGIPREDLERIFDPFYTTKKGGTGLGLPVCLEIVSRHKGRLDITCPTHGGTVASVLLPLKASESWPPS